MIISKIDGTQCKGLIGLSLNCHKNGITLLDYYIKYEGLVIPKCAICDHDSQFGGFKGDGPSFRKTCGNKKCLSELSSKRVVTEEQRENARKKRFEYLSKKSGKTAWERRSNGEMSFLEKWFFDEIIVENKLFNKYDVIYDYPVYPYFIDFAFLNIKLAVEVDGKCHFKNGVRVDHDIKKDNLLVEKGWKVYRIRFDEINDKTKKEFILFLDTIDNAIPKVYGNNLYRYFEIKKKPRTRKEYFKDSKNKFKEKQLPKIQKVLDADIDFSKHGWVKKLANIIGITSSHINRWMKSYMPEFYEEKCFKKQDRGGTSRLRKYGNKQQCIDARNEKYDKEQNMKLEMINNIDPTKKGWILEVSRLIGMKSKPATYSWIKRFAPDLSKYIKWK